MIVDENWYVQLEYELWKLFCLTFFLSNIFTVKIYPCKLNYNFTCRANDENALELDFGAMDFDTPRLTLSSSVGKGLNFITKFLTSKLNGPLEKAQPLVDYLLSLNYQGEVMMPIF